MNKKDPIFWWASGVFVLGLILYAITQIDIFFILLIAAYMLRPTLASLGLAGKYVDERELSIQYRSSNIAFFVMMIACVIFAAILKADNNHAGQMFNMVILIGIVAKALFSVLSSKNFREAAPKIIISVGLFAAIFAGMGAIHHGIFSISFLMNSLPGIVIALIGVMSRYYPRAIAVVMLIITISLMIFILRREISWATVGTALIVGVPLSLASFGLWRKLKVTEKEG